MIKPLANRLLISPIVESRSDILWTPDQLSRWGNGLLATKGKVLDIGPDVHEVAVGEVVHFSDSCGKPCAEGILIREDDVMFVDEEPNTIKAEWVGAPEVACE